MRSKESRELPLKELVCLLSPSQLEKAWLLGRANCWKWCEVCLQNQIHTADRRRHFQWLDIHWKRNFHFGSGHPCFALSTAALARIKLTVSPYFDMEGSPHGSHAPSGPEQGLK